MRKYNSLAFSAKSFLEGFMIYPNKNQINGTETVIINSHFFYISSLPIALSASLQQGNAALQRINSSFSFTFGINVLRI